jgi:hypothetical protein
MEKITKLVKLKAKWEENLDEVIKFWTENSIDKEHGGFYTCLDAKGTLGFNVLIILSPFLPSSNFHLNPDKAL